MVASKQSTFRQQVFLEIYFTWPSFSFSSLTKSYSNIYVAIRQTVAVIALLSYKQQLFICLNRYFNCTVMFLIL